MSFTNNAAAVKRQIMARMPGALEAMGSEAVSMVVAQMESGYGRPIRQTGALMADVSSQVSGDKVEVGNTLHYALYVHEGTCRMAGRPYTNLLLKCFTERNEFFVLAKLSGARRTGSTLSVTKRSQGGKDVVRMMRFRCKLV